MRKWSPLILITILLLSCNPMNRKYSPSTVQKDTLDIKKSGLRKESYQLLRWGIAQKVSNPHSVEFSKAKTYSDILRTVIEVEANKPKYFITIFANSFIKENPNYFNNDATMEEVDGRFEKNVLDTLRHVGIKMPLKLEGVKKNESKFYAHFSTTINGIEDRKFTHYFDVLGEISQKQAESLREGQMYNVKFTPFSFVRSTSFISKMSNKMAYSPSVSIRNDSYGNGYKVLLGVMVGAFDEIKSTRKY